MFRFRSVATTRRWLVSGFTECRGLAASTHLSTFCYSGRSFFVGVYVTTSDSGNKKVPVTFRKLLQRLGLGLCCRTHRICSVEDMVSEYESYEGRCRYNLFNAGKWRARRGRLRFDPSMMHAMAFGPLPAHFNGMPYSTRTSPKHLPLRMSLSIDRINASRGYVRGNVRFLPFWLNTVRNIFSDAKARRIAERMLGTRPRFSTELLPNDLHKRAQKKVNDKRSDAKRKGVHVGECFTFMNLLRAGKLITRCPYSGIRLHWEQGPPVGGRYDSASFDRCSSAGGYEVENVQVVAHSVNSFKSNLAISDLQILLSALDWLGTDEFSASHIPLCDRSAPDTLTN